VSHDGVVYEKDLGSETLDEFQRMELFNPDKSWTPVPEQGLSLQPTIKTEASGAGASNLASGNASFTHALQIFELRLPVL